jgi:hypothetical protein
MILSIHKQRKSVKPEHVILGKLKMRSALMGMAVSVVISLLGPTTAVSAHKLPEVAKSEQLPVKDSLIVAYYGRPGVKSLGILGEYPLEKIIPMIKAKAAEYQKIVPNQTVIPGFNIIHGLATREPGADKDYITHLSSEKLMKYIHAANQNSFAVFIDLQLGKMTPLEAVQSVLKYLKYDNVHIALDPEFQVHGLNVRPGKVIGSITGQDINQVQAAMSDYLEKNGITEKKILLIHMFTPRMIVERHPIKNYEKIKLVVNLDGDGSPELKVKIYNSLYTKIAATKIAAGFKVFFKVDKPKIMTPKQVLGIDPVSNNRIKEPPKYINYQ